MLKTKNPIKNVMIADDIITENTARIKRETITIIAKNINTKLNKKSVINAGFSRPYINLRPRLMAEIPRDAVQNRDMTEKERKLEEVLKKTSSNISLAVSKEASGINERNNLIISYSDTDAKSFIRDIKRVIKGMAEISI